MTLEEELSMSYLKTDAVNRQILKELGNMGSAPAVSCMGKCSIISVSQDCIVLGCPNSTVKGLIERIYKKKVQEAVQHILGRPMQIVCRTVEIVKPQAESDAPEAHPPCREQWEDEELELPF